MARGSEQAKTAGTTAQNLSGTYSGNAGALFSNLAPQLMTDAANPAGISPVDIARLDTASQESAGGSQAGAVGQGGLLAARTRNAGGTDAAVSGAARSAGQQLSTATTGTRLKNAALKQQQRASALSGLNSLFAENMGGGNQALGIVPQAVNADVNAENASWNWAKNLFTPIMTAAMGNSASVIKALQGGGGGG